MFARVVAVATLFFFTLLEAALLDPQSVPTELLKDTPVEENFTKRIESNKTASPPSKKTNNDSTESLIASWLWWGDNHNHGHSDVEKPFLDALDRKFLQQIATVQALMPSVNVTDIRFFKDVFVQLSIAVDQAFYEMTTMLPSTKVAETGQNLVLAAVLTKIAPQIDFEDFNGTLPSIPDFIIEKYAVTPVMLQDDDVVILDVLPLAQLKTRAFASRVKLEDLLAGSILFKGFVDVNGSAVLKVDFLDLSKESVYGVLSRLSLPVTKVEKLASSSSDKDHSLGVVDNNDNPLVGPKETSSAPVGPKETSSAPVGPKETSSAPFSLYTPFSSLLNGLIKFGIQDIV